MSVQPTGNSSTPALQAVQQTNQTAQGTTGKQIKKSGGRHHHHRQVSGPPQTQQTSATQSQQNVLSTFSSEPTSNQSATNTASSDFRIDTTA